MLHSQIHTSGSGLYDLFQTMERDRIILSFKGDITQDLLGSVYQIMESHMESGKEEPQRKKKFYHILVECLQNVYHHMAALRENPPVQDGASTAIFMIAQGADNSYRIITGNFILNGKVAGLQERIERINAMTPEALKKYYLETLNTTELSEKGGAGLGIIDMARKSGHKLEYAFHRVSDTYSFFTLAIVVS